jgi:hypothetical protein
MEARRGVLGVLIVLALLLAAPGGASAQTAVASTSTPDAGCPGPSDEPPFSPLGDRREAQTFAAQHTGLLDRVTFFVNNLSTNDPDFLVQILSTDQNGVPTDNVLAETAVPRDSVAGGVSEFDISFAQPASVTSGGVYAMAVSRPHANFLVPTWAIATRNPDACQGQSFYSYGPNLPWNLEPSPGDIIFQSYVNSFQITAPTGSGAAGFTLVNKNGRLFANVPAPGRLIVDDAHKGKGAKGSVKRTKARARRAGLVPLRIELTNKAIVRALKRHKLNLLAAVTYRPRGGQPGTLTFRIKAKL